MPIEPIVALVSPVTNRLVSNLEGCQRAFFGLVDQ